MRPSGSTATVVTRSVVGAERPRRGARRAGVPEPDRAVVARGRERSVRRYATAMTARECPRSGSPERRPRPRRPTTARCRRSQTTASVRPSGLNATLQTSPVPLRSGSPSGSQRCRVSHRRTSPCEVGRCERAPVRAERDARDLARVTLERASVRRSACVRRSHSQHGPVAAPEASVLPSGLKATLQTELRWPRKRRADGLLSSHVPQAHGVVGAAEGDRASVGAERDAPHALRHPHRWARRAGSRPRRSTGARSRRSSRTRASRRRG